MPGGLGPLLGQQAIDADDLIADGCTARGIQQQKVVEEGVEAVLLQLPIMVDHLAVAAEFLHEDLIAQVLRGLDLGRVARKANHIVRGGVGHGSWVLSGFGRVYGGRAPSAIPGGAGA